MEVVMAKGVIGIFTGGGDVPGLNPAIRAVTIRASREGYKVIGIRRGWAGMVDIIREQEADNSNNFQVLTEEIVNKAGRTGGTFLHTSRRTHRKLGGTACPCICGINNKDINDVTPEVLKNIDFLGFDYLIPIGGDDTLIYGVRMYQEGMKVVAIPKQWTTMCPAPIIASASARASPGRLNFPIVCARWPVHTNA